MSAPASRVPSVSPKRETNGWALRTVCSSSAIQLARSAASYSTSSSFSRPAAMAPAMASAANMPLFIAVCVPLIRGTLTKPAEQPPNRERQLRHVLPPAFVDRAGALRRPPSPLDHFADCRMVLPALEPLVRADPRVGVIERGDQAERHLAVRLVVQEPTAPGVAFRQRPSLGVDHSSRVMLGRVDLPQFLDAETVDLRLALGIEHEMGLQPLGQVSARAFGEQRVLGVELHARLIIGLLRAIGRDAHVL